MIRKTNRNILLVEPDYRSKFPPLGLLRLSSYHISKGDRVTFTRGRNEKLRGLPWHRVYVSSLFTYELPRTVKTAKYYSKAVETSNDLVVGGIAATLLPDYIRERVACRVIEGPLSSPRMINGERKPIAKYLPDYSIISDKKWGYKPEDSYFCRITTGCIRKCPFCAVPILEPEFDYFQPLQTQLREVRENYGERQHLVFLDNNILACDRLPSIIKSIYSAGFENGALRNNRQRTVDFNQGIDARLITKDVAQMLTTIALKPVRLAFDYKGIEKAYVRAIKHLAHCGFNEFTNYVMFNYKDGPKDFYYRIKLNTQLSRELGVRITGFPMKYSPVTDITRRFISKGWKWRYLRGIQCVLLATHGLVSPKPDFFAAAFGESFKEFLDILSMPDRYIIYREQYRNDGAADWKKLFRRLSEKTKSEFLDLLAQLNQDRNRKERIKKMKRFRALVEHYYPNGEVASS